MADEERLVVALEARVREFEKSFERANKTAAKNWSAIEARGRQASKQIESDLLKAAGGMSGQLGTVGALLGRIGPAGVLAGAGVGVLALSLTKAVVAANRFGDELIKLRNAAAVLGLTGTQLQAIQDVGAKFGIGDQDTLTALQRFIGQMDEFKRAQGTLFEIIQRIDPALAREMAAASDAAKQLDLLALAYERAGTSRQAALSRAAFGRTGFDLGLMIQEIRNAGGVAKITEAFTQAGDAIDNEMIKRIAQLRTEIADLRQDADRNIASLFSENILEQQRRYYQQFVELSRAAREFRVSDALKAMLGMGAATIAHAIPGAASLIPGATSEGRAEAARLSELMEKHAKITAEMERWQRLAETEPNPNVAGRASLVAENWAKQLIAVNAELESISKKLALGPMVPSVAPSGAGPAANVPMPRSRPADADRPSAEFEANAMRNWIAVLGEAATPAEQLRLKKLELAAAAEKYGLSQGILNRALGAFVVAQQKAAVAARSAAGIASELEMESVALAQVKELEARGWIRNEEEKAAATRMLKQQSREAFEQMKIAASQTPNLTRFALEGRDAMKQLDQFGVSSLGNLENAFADVITETKDAKAAFADLTKAVLADLARMIIRMQITAPLAAALGGGGANGGGGLLAGLFGGARAEGGPVDPGRAYLVGESGPEILVPRVPGRIVPNGDLAALKPLSAGGGGVGGVIQSNTFHISVTGASGTVAQNDQLAQRIGRELKDAASSMVASELRRQMRPQGMLRSAK